MRVRIITFRDIFQYEAGKRGRFADEYRRLSAQIILDKEDMERIGVEDGGSVQVENDAGEIVVAARRSEDDSHPGIAFMVNSPWSNQLVNDNLSKSNTSIPEFKNIEASISPSGRGITGISELLERMTA
jgi:formylmethanofuran dehydrogenase subunit D